MSYSFKIKVNRKTGECLNSDCECPAGKGPNGTCKHIAAVLLMLVNFIESGQLTIKKSCTESLQTFHKPNAVYTGKSCTFNNLPDCSDPQDLVGVISWVL